MTHSNGSILPFLDRTVLDRLRADLEDHEGVWKALVQAFIERLPYRVERLRLALAAGDFPAAMDAVLSLKISSQRLGGERLADLAQGLQMELHNSPGTEHALTLPQLAEAHLEPLRSCGSHTAYLLQAHLEGRRSSTPELSSALRLAGFPTQVSAPE
ncbi:Hpt domain protein [Arthrobacter sp. 9AX]|uniref:Hpt domain-containing protein n=1 Tax=Arthrobacter sp. 9AX TaxID=2653131 RepID=UPI0012F211C9|nr:Hpt domain-containing protein [Arthrobacter sp. 9AX]VXB75932.1 Hpt domain protein [Arthrobacter sp. 9AX]